MDAEDKIDEKIWGNPYMQFRNLIFIKVREQIEDQVSCVVSGYLSSVSFEVEDQVRDQVFSEIRELVCFQIKNRSR